MTYVSVVTDYFASRTGGDHSLSPEDYATIAEWEKQEIPLSFVLNTIDRVMLESQARPSETCSIGELDRSVNIRFVEWLQTQRSAATF
jgi:hypothetical protein